MRKLERGTNVPPYLNQQHPEPFKWDPGQPEKDAIWRELNAMQNGRCAYCEADISTFKSRHIEHFASRERHKDKTFDWDNLFGSCNRKESCGTYKDTGGHPYDWTALTKPDIHNPDDYLLFGQKGTIVVRPDINPADQHRARETLRVFNLDATHGELRKEREIAIKPHLEFYKEVFEIWLADPDSLNLDEVLQDLFDHIAQLPFCTAIRHALTSRHTHQSNLGA